MKPQDHIDAQVVGAANALIERVVREAVEFIDDRDDDVEVLRVAFYRYLAPAQASLAAMGYAAARDRSGPPTTLPMYWLLLGDIMNRAGIVIEGGRYVHRSPGDAR